MRKAKIAREEGRGEGKYWGNGEFKREAESELRLWSTLNYARAGVP